MSCALFDSHRSLNTLHFVGIILYPHRSYIPFQTAQKMNHVGPDGFDSLIRNIPVRVSELSDDSDQEDLRVGEQIKRKTTHGGVKRRCTLVISYVLSVNRKCRR